VIIETIRLSQQAKDQLVNLKRKTGIENWNVLCRWAFFLSLSEPSIPPASKIPSDSNVEMSWRVFGGTFAEVFDALFVARCEKDEVDIEDEKKVAEHFKLHLHRGIAYLANDKKIKDILGLAELAGKRHG